MRWVGMLSGGEGSWAACKRYAQRHGVKSGTLVFCDTLSEDADTYRFLEDSSRNIGAPLVKLCDGRDIWQVFRDSRFLGNNLNALCSRILKREICQRWLDANCVPDETVCVYGIGAEEVQRYWKIRKRMAELGYRTAAPLCDNPVLSHLEIKQWVVREGLKRQRLYNLLMPHANCRGGCVRAGQSHFKQLLETLPDVYAHWEAKEEEIRQFLKKDVSILSDRSGDGKKKPLTLRAFREIMQSGGKCEPYGPTGCGCFIDDDEEVEAA